MAIFDGKAAASRDVAAGAARGDLGLLLSGLKAGGDPSALAFPKDGETALMSAASWGRVDAVLALVEAGADARVVDQVGSTALMRAAMHGRAACVEALLSASDARAVDQDGCEALALAAAGGHAACVRLLLPASSPRAFDSTGRTALMRAAGANSKECVEALLPWSDALATDSLGRSAANWADAIPGRDGSLAGLLGAWVRAAGESVALDAKVLPSVSIPRGRI